MTTTPQGRRGQRYQNPLLCHHSQYQKQPGPLRPAADHRQEANEHLKDHRQEGELHGIQDGLAEVGVAEELRIVPQSDKGSGLLEVPQEVVIRKTVEEGER